MIKKIFLCIWLIVITLVLGGCLPGIFPPAPAPTPSPTLPVDNATMLGVALTDISNGQGGYTSESQTHPRIDKNLIVELNRLLSNRVYREAFVTKIEIINVVWLTPNNSPGTEDVLIMIDCNGGEKGNCTVKRTASETILILRWLPVVNGSSTHPESTATDGKFWAFPANTRNVFFYTCDSKQRQGFIRVSGEHINAYLNGSLPGESLSTLSYIKALP